MKLRILASASALVALAAGSLLVTPGHGWAASSADIQMGACAAAQSPQAITDLYMTTSGITIDNAPLVAPWAIGATGPSLTLSSAGGSSTSNTATIVVGGAPLVIGGTATTTTVGTTTTGSTTTTTTSAAGTTTTSATGTTTTGATTQAAGTSGASLPMNTGMVVTNVPANAAATTAVNAPSAGYPVVTSGTSSTAAGTGTPQLSNGGVLTTSTVPGQIVTQQYGYLNVLRGISPTFQAGTQNQNSALFTFYSTAVTSQDIVGGANRIVSHSGTMTIYLANGVAGNFANPTTFRSGTPVMTSTFNRQLVVDVVGQTWTDSSIHQITSTTPFALNGACYQLGMVGQFFKLTNSGQLATLTMGLPQAGAQLAASSPFAAQTTLTGYFNGVGVSVSAVAPSASAPGLTTPSLTMTGPSSTTSGGSY